MAVKMRVSEFTDRLVEVSSKNRRDIVTFLSENPHIKQLALVESEEGFVVTFKDPNYIEEEPIQPA